MDSLTHLALGAVTGEAVGRTRLGKKAIALGAAAQFFPDIDFVAAFWLSPAENLVAHRGITHSLLFSVLSTVAFAVVAKGIQSKKPVSAQFWLVFFGTQAGLHIFIDTFNAYGIGIWEPFHSVRFSLHSLFVFDPLFSIWVFLAAIVLMLTRNDSPDRIRWVYFSLIACSVYLFISLVNKSIVDKEVKMALRRERIQYDDFITTPTPLNNLLWYVIVKVDDGYYTGYRSVFDGSSRILLNHFQFNDDTITTTELPDVSKKLVTLSQGYYTYHINHDTLSISLITFGQVAGWSDPDAAFVLNCDLVPQETSVALLQEGRAKEMNLESFAALMRRIFNKP